MLAKLDRLLVSHSPHWLDFNNTLVGWQQLQGRKGWGVGGAEWCLQCVSKSGRSMLFCRVGLQRFDADSGSLLLKRLSLQTDATSKCRKLFQSACCEVLATGDPHGDCALLLAPRDRAIHSL